MCNPGSRAHCGRPVPGVYGRDDPTTCEVGGINRHRRSRSGLPALLQTAGPLRLRGRRAVRKHGFAAHPAAPAGAGSRTRHRTFGGAAFQRTDPQRWAILYLGSVKAATVLPDRDIVVVNRNGNAADRQEQALCEIEGIILLDGTWSQAKALWWRNAWMLKCKRVVLGPKRPSRYGKLRREPRKDGLSTIEAAAMLLARLERKPDIESTLNASFERLLARYRTIHPVAPPRHRR